MFKVSDVARVQAAMLKEADLLAVLKQHWDANKGNLEKFLEMVKVKVEQWVRGRMYTPTEIMAALRRATNTEFKVFPNGLIEAR